MADEKADEKKSSQEKSVFIISLKHSSELERLAGGPTLFRKTPEELKAMREEKQRMIEQPKQYLDSLGLAQDRDYKLLVNLCRITASLTPEQAKLLKEQHYVGDVFEDFGLGLID